MSFFLLNNSLTSLLLKKPIRMKYKIKKLVANQMALLLMCESQSFLFSLLYESYVEYIVTVSKKPSVNKADGVINFHVVMKSVSIYRKSLNAPGLSVGFATLPADKVKSTKL